MQRESTKKSIGRWTQATSFPAPIPLSLNKKTSVFPIRPLIGPYQRQKGNAASRDKSNRIHIGKDVKKHG